MSGHHSAYPSSLFPSAYNADGNRDMRVPTTDMHAGTRPGQVVMRESEFI
jgi:hypothetical protein